jgi:Leucine-rich repeat (LRR) protein
MPIYHLSEELVAEVVKGYRALSVLNLSSNRIARIENLAPLTVRVYPRPTPNTPAFVRPVSLRACTAGSPRVGSTELLTPPRNVPTAQRLEKLDLSRNEITTVENLSCLPRLRELRLARNRVRTLHASALAGLTVLTTLDLADNLLHDKSTLSALATLPALTHLTLHGNPLAALHRYRSGACLYAAVFPSPSQCAVQGAWGD